MQAAEERKLLSAWNLLNREFEVDNPATVCLLEIRSASDRRLDELHRKMWHERGQFRCESSESLNSLQEWALNQGFEGIEEFDGLFHGTKSCADFLDGQTISFVQRTRTTKTLR